jgi:energy-coupling factor transport system ATP-binding protein
VAEPVLHASGLSYRYAEASHPALSGVDLSIDPGEFVVLAGRSGSGKSTLLRAACGLVPHFHGGEVEGELAVAGLDVRSHGPAELAALVGLVAQEAETQVVSTTVRAEIELPLELRGAVPAARSRAVEEVSLALAIDGLLDRTTDTLSGGELQRVALAAALATRPKLVLLDEPTSQLDPVAGDELISLLRRLNEEWGVSVLLGEHRLERCLAAADRVVALVEGSIGFDGNPQAFLHWAVGSDPALATPGARLLRGVGLPPAASVREARRRLQGSALAQNVPQQTQEGVFRDAHPPAPRRVGPADTALAVRDLWIELGDGEQWTEALRGLDLRVGTGERIALMGRNGAGKSTLLRAAAGLVEPLRGRIEAGRGVALLPQRPGDLFVSERVGAELRGEAGKASLRRFGLDRLADSDPRDLSGGERQRLALAIALAGRDAPAGDLPGVLLLDEPTRGMDRARKGELGALVRSLSGEGVAVMIATHDVEFAVTFAERVVLLGRGEVVADGSPDELLAGGWYFSSEVARILDGAAVTVEEGIDLIQARPGRVPDRTASTQHESGCADAHPRING